MSFDLAGRTALVTGCRRGIGKGAAIALAAAGADVVGVSANLEPGDEVAVEIEALGRRFNPYRCDLAEMPIEDNCVDVMMARSVMEHITDPARVYREAYRVLKPGGQFIFLTANLWDYASIIATVIPNRFHPWIVSKTEGRKEHDVFPIAYRTNTRGAVRKWADHAGFEIVSFRYLGQYPSYFMFNGFLFWLATGYEKLISRVPCLNFLQGWIFVTLRKP